MTDDKVREIAQKLLEKSRARQVNWRKRGVFAGAGKNLYEVALPTATVAVGFRTPPTDPDEYLLRIDSRGQNVKLLKVSDEGSRDWLLLSALYNEAERRVTGWDDVVREIEDALEGSEPIGEPLPPNSDDIPF